MKHFLIYLRTALLVFAVAIGVTGCNKDDDEKDGGNPIAGKMFYFDFPESCNLIKTESNYCYYSAFVITFNANGTAESLYADWIGDKIVFETDDFTPTYKVEGDNVIITVPANEDDAERKEIWKIEKKNGVLMIVDEGIDDDPYVGAYRDEYKEIKGNSPKDILTELMNKHKDHPHSSMN